MGARSEKARLVERVLGLQEEVFRALRPMAHHEWLSVELTMSQLKVLLLLFIDGPARMGTLASALGVSLATTTGIVDRLVERGFVLREDDPSDRRVVVCRLSDQGEELVGRLWEQGQARARELLVRLTAAKLRLVCEALEAILEAASVADREATATGALRRETVRQPHREAGGRVL